MCFRGLLLEGLHRPKALLDNLKDSGCWSSGIRCCDGIWWNGRGRRDRGRGGVWPSCFVCLRRLCESHCTVRGIVHLALRMCTHFEVSIEICCVGGRSYRRRSWLGGTVVRSQQWNVHLRATGLTCVWFPGRQIDRVPQRAKLREEVPEIGYPGAPTAAGI